MLTMLVAINKYGEKTASNNWIICEILSKLQDSDGVVQHSDEIFKEHFIEVISVLPVVLVSDTRRICSP